MKIKIFKYYYSNPKFSKNGIGRCIDTEQIENEINTFCQEYKVVDIKVNIIDYSHYYENKDYEGIMIIYTVMYEYKYYED